MKLGIPNPAKSNYFPKGFYKKEVPAKFQGNFTIFVDADGNFLSQKEANISEKEVRVYDIYDLEHFELRHHWIPSQFFVFLKWSNLITNPNRMRQFHFISFSYHISHLNFFKNSVNNEGTQHPLRGKRNIPWIQIFNLNPFYYNSRISMEINQVHSAKGYKVMVDFLPAYIYNNKGK